MEHCLLVPYTTLPDDLRNRVKGWFNFQNDVLLRPPSEWGDDWKDLSQDSIERYFNDQKATNNFEGTLDDFIDKYGLHLEVWLVENHAEDLLMADQVFVDVCW